MAPSVKVREAKATDISRLNEVAKLSKMYWNYPSEWLELWKNDLTIKSENLKHWIVKVAEVNQNITAFGAIKESEEIYEIMHLWVVPQYIGQGIGRILLKGLISALNSNKSIMVESDPNAAGFYEKMDFTHLGSVPSQPTGRFLPILSKENITNLK